MDDVTPSGLDVDCLTFDEWLVLNYGFHPDGTPVRFRPPMFVDSEGMFDVPAHDQWVSDRHQDYLREKT
jgi:hypothetical protein